MALYETVPPTNFEHGGCWLCTSSRNNIRPRTLFVLELPLREGEKNAVVGYCSVGLLYLDASAQKTHRSTTECVSCGKLLPKLEDFPDSDTDQVLRFVFVSHQYLDPAFRMFLPCSKRLNHLKELAVHVHGSRQIPRSREFHGIDA